MTTETTSPGLLGSYKAKVLFISLAVAIVPVIGAFVLAGMRVATVDQAFEMTKWSLSAGTLSAVATIIGRSLEGMAEKGSPQSVTQVASGGGDNKLESPAKPAPTDPAIVVVTPEDK
jgi:hypothetical protein